MGQRNFISPYKSLSFLDWTKDSSFCQHLNKLACWVSSPSTPTSSFLRNRPGQCRPTKAQQNHGDDAIARSDALAYPDSTQDTECVRLKQMFNPLVPNTCTLRTPFVWKEATGQKGPDNRNSGNRWNDQFLLLKRRGNTGLCHPAKTKRLDRLSSSSTYSDPRFYFDTYAFWKITVVFSGTADALQADGWWPRAWWRSKDGGEDKDSSL
jgi:hypothetical protein